MGICKKCGKRRKVLSQRGICKRCRELNCQNAALQLKAKEGPYYDKWKTGMKKWSKTL